VIYLCNKDQRGELFFLVYFSNHPLYVLNRLTIRYQEVALLYMQHMVYGGAVALFRETIAVPHTHTHIYI